MSYHAQAPVSWTGGRPITRVSRSTCSARCWLVCSTATTLRASQLARSDRICLIKPASTRGGLPHRNRSRACSSADGCGLNVPRPSGCGCSAYPNGVLNRNPASACHSIGAAFCADGHGTVTTTLPVGTRCSADAEVYQAGTFVSVTG